MNIIISNEIKVIPKFGSKKCDNALIKIVPSFLSTFNLMVTYKQKVIKRCDKSTLNQCMEC